MSRIIVAAFTGILTGFALSHFGAQEAGERSPAAPPVPSYDSAECSPDDSMQAQRIEPHPAPALEQEIARLEKEIERLTAREPVRAPVPEHDWFRQTWAALDTEERPVDRRQQLVDGGFDAMRADWIAGREAELEQAFMDGAPLDYLQVRLQMRKALRAELGDFEYERYLSATGQSTTVAVTQVLPDSVAAQGGLQVGDAIVEYDGKRVFNVFELGDATGNGALGEFVVVNVERDGSPMQLVLPRGSLGISAGRPVQAW